MNAKINREKRERKGDTFFFSRVRLSNSLKAKEPPSNFSFAGDLNLSLRPFSLGFITLPLTSQLLVICFTKQICTCFVICLIKKRKVRLCWFTKITFLEWIQISCIHSIYRFLQWIRIQVHECIWILYIFWNFKYLPI